MNRRTPLFLSLTFATLLGASPVDAQQEPTPDEELKAFLEAVNRPVNYSVPGMDQVVVRKDIAYRTDGDTQLKMDLYLPPGTAKGAWLPVFVFIHGGIGPDFPLRPKDWGLYITYARAVAASGLAAVTFNHRLGFPDPQLDKAGSDVTALVDYVRANAGALQIDRDRICLASFSAGGPLLSMAMRDTPPYVRCLVATYSFLDIQRTEHHKQFHSPEVVRAFSPITYLDRAARIPPMLIVRAGRDQIPMMNDSIDRFVQAALAANLNFELLNHPEAPHGFENALDSARTREVIARVIEFAKYHLRR